MCRCLRHTENDKKCTFKLSLELTLPRARIQDLPWHDLRRMPFHARSIWDCYHLLLDVSLFLRVAQVCRDVS